MLLAQKLPSSLKLYCNLKRELRLSFFLFSTFFICFRTIQVQARSATTDDVFDDESHVSFSPLLRVGRSRNYSANSTRSNADAIANIIDSGKTESFVNVSWDPTCPEGVSANSKTSSKTSQRLNLC